MIWAIIAITISLLFVIISIIQRHAAQTMTSQLILTSQTPTNRAMRYAQEKLPQMFPRQAPISSTLIANVWGHGVMAFEFCFDELKFGNQTVAITELEKQLNNYARENHLVGYKGLTTPFRVTDFWQAIHDGNEWHIDITYVVNEVTLEYLHDIEKLNNR